MPHNHPPRCCCETHLTDWGEVVIVTKCTSCVEHGELAELSTGVCGFRHLIAPEQVCTIPPHPVGTVHSWDRPPECVSCHQPEGRPHTEYCKRENRDYPGQPGVRPDGRNLTQYDPTSYPPPHVDLVGALGKAVDAADATAQTKLDDIAAEAYVDDGCRCPTRTPHTPGCPVLPHIYGYTMNGNEIVDTSCVTCGGPKTDPRHT